MQFEAGTPTTKDVQRSVFRNTIGFALKSGGQRIGQGGPVVRGLGVGWRLAGLALATLLLAGCAAYNRSTLVSSGPGSNFVSSEVQAFREVQDKVVDELITASGQTKASSPPLNWDLVIASGMDYADHRCEEYLHALFRLDRDKKTGVAQIGLLGGATAGVQAAIDAAAKEVAIAALLFSLAGSTVENVASNLLYELEPSSVRTLVKSLQAAYRANLGEGYKTRPAAIAAIRSYAILCIPANIEAEVNLAVKKAQPEAKPGEPAKGQPPIITNSTTVSTTSFGADESSKLLDAFVNPNGKMDPNNERRLLEYMKANGIDPSTRTNTFIFGKAYAAARKDAVKHFGLN